jgi:hypothetical protein
MGRGRGCPGDEECLNIPQCGTRERLRCLAIIPGALLFVAGGIGQGDGGAASDDAATDNGKYCVHCGAGRPRSPRLDCETVTRRQTRLNGSEDSTVRVWSLPPRASVAAADVGALRVVDLLFDGGCLRAIPMEFFPSGIWSRAST